MTTATVFGVTGSLLIGLGLYGLIIGRGALRKILAFNLLGSGVFLVFGVIAQRGAAAGFPGDPIPQALVITGLVVAFAATALAVALLTRLAETSGRTDVEDAPAGPAPPLVPAAQGAGPRGPTGDASGGSSAQSEQGV